MKHIILFVITVVTVNCLFVEPATGHTGTGTDRARPVCIKGRVVGGTPSRDTIQLIFIKVDVFDGTVGNESTTVVTNGAGVFECQLPPIDHPGRIEFILKGYGGKYVNNNNALYGYMVEPGDSVFFTITRTPDSLRYQFTGTGAAKFECRRKLDLVDQTIERVDGDRLSSGTFWDIHNWKNRCMYADSLIAGKIEMVNGYKKDLTPMAAQLLRADIIGYLRHRYVTNFYTPEYVAKNKAAIVQTYRPFLSQAPDTVNGDQLAWSPEYVKYLMNRGLLELYVRSGGDERYNVAQGYKEGLAAWYAALKQRYKGTLREMLLMSLLTINKVANGAGYDSCLRDVLTVIRNPELTALANRWSTAKLKGSRAYNFNLVDTAGNVVRLVDLKGKMVLIDIWFTGCGGCRAMAEELKENLYPHFTNNKAVAFVSISGDKDRNTWLNSVREEKYTVKTNINLYTNGTGFEDPFMKYYDFYGGPYLMIIDREGKIFTCAPPHTGSDLTVFLNQALLE